MPTVFWALVALALLGVFVVAVPLAGIPVLAAALVGLVVGGTLILLRRRG